MRAADRVEKWSPAGRSDSGKSSPLIVQLAGGLQTQIFYADAMHIAEGQNADRKKFHADALELAGMLQEWDPIGVYEGEEQNPFPGEYDDLVMPIMSALRTPAGRQSLADGLKKLLRDDYGLGNVDDTDVFASKVSAWWVTKQD